MSIELEIDEFEEFDLESPFDYWKDGSGTIHKISEMTTEHIYNCIKGISASMLFYVRGYGQNVFSEEFVSFEGREYLIKFYDELDKRRLNYESEER